jgi:ribosomal-protein-alanine N-acetyltransferase
MPGARIASGDRVTLRTEETEDVPFLQRARANPELRHPIGNPVTNQEQMGVPAERPSSDHLLVCLDDESAGPGQPAEDETERIGRVGVVDAHYKRPELGYFLVPEAQGEGYGREMLELAIDYTFGQYDTPVVSAKAFGFNEASRGLLESLGFEEEGRLRKYMFVDGAHRDMVFYGLLGETWQSEA